ncbi:Arginine N-succinyltransferase subunit beta [Rubripirellula obstinata]|uniref:Arginine N-succinyltransferase subunit beta n=1 Tax=Rubripirellula obstinata TaxID=406547 RepID=A0A5B1CM63_9BACT|nr:arginine N-succinyltransferase [Rubripirellula obstinata]KAA1261371.1 Arginine N-succinyltransferase subunit beta [Rubripirellula obstinata]
MWIVRAVRTSDLDSLCSLVALATQGLTSLQLDRDQLLDRVEQSVFAFSRRGMSPRGEPFVLVMVEPESGQIVGTSTVYAKTGGYQPFYVYQRVVSQHRSEQLGVGQTRERLELQRTHDGPTEIGSLFLRQRCRGDGRGRWLSLARFALIAGMRHRFADRVIAEMRGLALSDGTVPFWEAVTSRFIPVNFAVADTLSTVSKQFIEEMMPQYPIYADLLPAEVRAAIGQVHPETKPALAMLQKEGFAETDQIDIFDGGPVVSCETDKIKAVQRTQSVTVASVIDKLSKESDRVILVSDKDGFTSTLTSVVSIGDEVSIASSAAQALDLDVGSACWVLPI